ncbi:DUF4440 domain-containing protein [Nitrosomonas supralitoralis]|uniref:DUF4440 domain-containing protein n=1 Tax=Nitrosomonas supralitoralis TaxID=2116706 RepID=A0A2P7NZH0_9PROT|nr:DUF4440 domain-containing protein [Nitrosomonas supralitoralis]PSJ18838.1 hypothetical protein C7H79_01030 [Nitrosomonas supralitoralis]
MDTIAEQILQLELKLLQSDLKAHPELIDELLAENFEEIDSDGEIRTRGDVIGWLLHKDLHIQWVFKEFRVKALTGNLVLAIYSLHKPDQLSAHYKGSIRTSIWQCQRNQWKMVFHQASRKS